jgi:hypothetical protein
VAAGEPRVGGLHHAPTCLELPAGSLSPPCSGKGELAKLPLPFQRASALASQNVVERGEEGYTAGKPSSRASTSAPVRRGGVNDYWSRLQGIGNPYFCWLLHKSLL